MVDRWTLRSAGVAGVVLAVALGVSLAAGTAFGVGARSQEPGVPSTGGSETDLADVRRVAGLFYAGKHDEVVLQTESLVARRSVSPATVAVLVFRAESFARLGRRDESVRAYEHAARAASSLNEVDHRTYAFVHFRLAMLARASQQLIQAVAHTEAGLRLEPQNTQAQILLGSLLAERGDRESALRHFREVAASSLPTNEERAVLAMKIDRLTAGRIGASVRPPDLREARLHDGVSIGLVPLPDVPRDLPLADVCVVLEAAWRVGCVVLEPIAIPDDRILVTERAQLDGERVLDELRRRLPRAIGSLRYLIAVTGRDLFGPDTAYVFSWQVRGADYGIGVISTYRFAASADDFYERDAVVVRRTIVQALSTSGSMLGFDRPMSPECPTAFPLDFREFQQKKTRLCRTEVEQRDALLRTRGGQSKAFGDELSREVERVYRAYYLE